MEVDKEKEFWGKKGVVVVVGRTGRRGREVWFLNDWRKGSVIGE